MAVPIRLTIGQVYLVSWPGTVTGTSLTLSGTMSSPTVVADTIKLDVANQDVILTRGAANVLVLRNGAAAQGFRIGPASDYLYFDKGAGDASIYVISADPLNLGTNDILRWQIGGSTGHLIAGGNYNANITHTALGVTSTDGLIVANSTAAAAGAQQMPPRLRFDGFGWKTDATAASQAVSVIQELLPVQGAAAPTANLLWKYAVNGGAYSTILTLASSGSITVPTDITYGNDIIGPSGGKFKFGAQTRLIDIGDGIFRISNAAETDATRLIIGTNNTATTGVSFVKEVGHLIERRGDGSTGTLSVANVGANSCGTSAATITGTDKAFRVTVGATSGTECRVTFVSAWTTAPVCVGNNETTANLMRTDSPTTTIIDLVGTFVGGDVISVICAGY